MSDGTVDTIEKGVSSDLIFEVKDNQNITDADMENFSEMTRDELAWYLGSNPQDENEERVTSIFNHIQAFKYLKRSLVDNVPVSVIFCRDSSNKFIGYSIFFLPTPDSNGGKTQDFIGVRTENRRQGVGLGILQKRIDVLLSMGITSYESDARVGVRKLYDRLGVNYTATPIPKNITENGDMHLMIHLK